MSKRAKLITIITSAVVAVTLIILAVCLVVANNKREKTETTIMSLSVNPSIQFVLNGNDKVMNVVSLNNDGKMLELKGEFTGLKADEAVRVFVKLSVEAGYISADTTGTQVDITLSGLNKNYKGLKDKVIKSANDYFDENGIIAGAVVSIENSLKDSVLKLKSTANGLEDETEAELMKHYLQIAELVDGMLPADISTFFDAYDKAWATYEEELAKINAQIKVVEDTLANFTGTETEKANLEKNLDGLKRSIGERARERNKAISQVLDSAKENETTWQNLLQELNAKITANVEKLTARQEYFEAHKTDVKNAIDNYRETLAK